MEVLGNQQFHDCFSCRFRPVVLLPGFFCRQFFYFREVRMEIVQDKALLFNTRKAAQITAIIPKSKVIDSNGDVDRVLVNWDFDEVQLLRNLGIKDVPSPITNRYQWPGMYTPFEHQKDTAEFLTLHPRCFVFNEAGTGKTSAAAWAADYLMTKGRVKRVLVICPVSIMETAWRSDLFKTVMHRTVAIAQGTRTQRQAVVKGDYEFVIINFDGVKVVTPELQEGGFDLIIVDEANAIKSVSTERWKAMASLVKPTTRLWLMTGTPASQSPLDAYGLAKLVNPEGVPRFFGAFRDRVMIKITQYKWMPRQDAQQIVHNILQPAIRFTKAECLDLPDMLYSTREVPLTAQQTKYYEALRKEMMTIAAGSEITAVNAASMLNKLLQVSQGAVYTDDKAVVEFDVTNRVNELLDVIASTDHKVLVFVPYRHTLQMLEDEMAKAGYTSAVIHGGVSATQRADIIKQFQTEDDPRVLLMIPQATAHGITLTRADQVVWWGPVASTEIYLQANSRAHRAGQTNKVTVTHLQGSPVERRMYAMLQNKIDLHQNLVDLYKKALDDKI
jgi:SNF2 family DNA or RNA helicase